jgi:hypothetical protein
MLKSWSLWVENSNSRPSTAGSMGLLLLLLLAYYEALGSGRIGYVAQFPLPRGCEQTFLLSLSTRLPLQRTHKRADDTMQERGT